MKLPFFPHDAQLTPPKIEVPSLEFVQQMYTTLAAAAREAGNFDLVSLYNSALTKIEETRAVASMSA